MPFISVDPNEPARSIIAEAAQVLRRGGLVAFPTERVYGLGAHAVDAVDAVDPVGAADVRGKGGGRPTNS